MFKLGQKVVIVSDSFEQNLPVGEFAFVIAYERNPDNAFDFMIRIPKLNRNFFIPASDIELESNLLKVAADRVEREALIDYALSTRNESLFRTIISDYETQQENKDPAKIARDEFIKQIHLKAWI